MEKWQAKQEGISQLIVALDYSSWEQAEKTVLALPEVLYFKVGLELYLATGGAAVAMLRRLGKEVFLDLKFHDIPHTVAQASRQAVRQEAAIFNVHAAGGREMMQAAAAAVRQEAVPGGKRPLLIAVTVLTSLNDDDLQEIGLPASRESVEKLARLAKGAGLDGVVASPLEIGLIRRACGPDYKIICPGVRPVWAASSDQKRVMTPSEAIRSGADFIVVGRPITQAADPREAARKIIHEIREGLSDEQRRDN